MVAMKAYYARCNALWPAELPIPTERQAVNAAKRLWRWGTGKTYAGPVHVTSGRRYTWMRRGVLAVNPNRPGREGGGWRALVHDMGHLLHTRLNPEARPHTKEHARLEIAMVKECIKRGWLKPEDAPAAPAAPAEAPKQDATALRYERVKARLASWEKKERRAKNAIKKLRRQAAYYERRLAA